MEVVEHVEVVGLWRWSGGGHVEVETEVVENLELVRHEEHHLDFFSFPSHK